MRRLLVLALVCLAGCGGSEAKKPSPTPALEGLIGKEVDIGGGRSLFLQCSGSGSPTVLLEGGFGADAHAWDGVRPDVARTTRTCAYDRAGTGSSIPPSGLRDANDELADLESLLQHAKLPPPYVIAGHSYGGVLARVFARRHPGEVAGLVLVDTVGRNGRARQLAIWPRTVASKDRPGLADHVLNNIDLSVGEGLASRLSTFGDKPLAVISAGHESNFPRPLYRPLSRLWMRMQDELAQLSSNSVHVVASSSDHDIPGGQPEVIVDALNAVVRAARDGSELPPCREIFSGDVRCR